MAKIKIEIDFNLKSLKNPFPSYKSLKENVKKFFNKKTLITYAVLTTLPFLIKGAITEIKYNDYVVNTCLSNYETNKTPGLQGKEVKNLLSKTTNFDHYIIPEEAVLIPYPKLGGMILKGLKLRIDWGGGDYYDRPQSRKFVKRSQLEMTL